MPMLQLEEHTQARRGSDQGHDQQVWMMPAGERNENDEVKKTMKMKRRKMDGEKTIKGGVSSSIGSSRSSSSGDELLAYSSGVPIAYPTPVPTTVIVGPSAYPSPYPTSEPTPTPEPTPSGLLLYAAYVYPDQLYVAYTVPVGVFSLLIFARGAQGGKCTYCDSGTWVGGLGGSIQAVVSVTPGQVLFVYVGGMGLGAPSGTSDAGGYNGGGSGDTNSGKRNDRREI